MHLTPVGEVKRFQVICSHLNPGSVMHMYVGDSEDLRLLVTSRTEDAHVHMCVDAQTGLGTSASRPGSSNICTATTITHRPGKNKEYSSLTMTHVGTPTCYSSASSWNTCSHATNTLRNDRSTTSCHQTSVCVRRPSTHRLRLRITGVLTATIVSKRRRKPTENVSQETNRMGMS